MAMETLFGVGLITLVGLVVLGAAFRPKPPAQPTTVVLLTPAAPKADQDSGIAPLLLMLLATLIILSMFQV
jgi:hypothetical protein